MKKLALLAAFSIISGIKANPCPKSCNELNIHDLIVQLADRLYCISESTGGGKNNKRYNKAIDEYTAKIKVCLEQEGTKVNEFENGTTALMKAAGFHSWEIIELLIQAGADIYLKDQNGHSALDYAVARSKSAGGNIWQYVINIVMSPYYTKQRHNKCIDLLTNNILKRIWFKRYDAEPKPDPARKLYKHLRKQIDKIDEENRNLLCSFTPRLKLHHEFWRLTMGMMTGWRKGHVQSEIDHFKKALQNSRPLMELYKMFEDRYDLLPTHLQKNFELLEDAIEKEGLTQDLEERINQFKIELDNFFTK